MVKSIFRHTQEREDNSFCNGFPSVDFQAGPEIVSFTPHQRNYLHYRGVSMGHLCGPEHGLL